MQNAPPRQDLVDFWRAYDSTEQRLTAGLSERMLEIAELRDGVRVLDIATGRGEPAIRAAHRVMPTGSVLGIDTSDEMLQFTRVRAERECVANLELRVQNAETLRVDDAEQFDVTLARWALM